jgi:hypothetical protein
MPPKNYSKQFRLEKSLLNSETHFRNDFQFRVQLLEKILQHTKSAIVKVFSEKHLGEF